MASKLETLKAENEGLKKEIEELRNAKGSGPNAAAASDAIGNRVASMPDAGTATKQSNNTSASTPSTPSSKIAGVFAKMRRGSSPAVYASEGETTPKAKTSLAKKFGVRLSAVNHVRYLCKRR
jgi:septal ring factor EnvC (AmiA/AmiB activator)